MLSPAADRSEALRPPLPAVIGADERTKLRAELDALNAELKELKSTDFAVRAYFETWLAFLGTSVAAKLFFDWHKTHGKAPIVAFPVLFLALALVVDVVAQRRKQHRLEKEEAKKMARQRELRGVLGLDDAPVPADDAPAHAALA